MKTFPDITSTAKFLFEKSNIQIFLLGFSLALDRLDFLGSVDKSSSLGSPPKPEKNCSGGTAPTPVKMSSGTNRSTENLKIQIFVPG